MKVCEKCQTENLDDAKVCSNCGEDIEVKEEAQVEPEVVVEEISAEPEVAVEETPVEVEAVVEETPVEAEAVAQEAPAEAEVAVEEAPAEVEAVAQEAPVEVEVAVEEAPAEVEVAEEAPVEVEAVVEEVSADVEAVAEEAPVEAEVVAPVVIAQETPVEAAPVEEKKVYCRHCGAANKPDAKFCCDCGKNMQVPVQDPNATIVKPVNVSNEPSIKSGMSKFFGVIWIIFAGIWSVIEYAVLGVAYLITLVGIPTGLGCFKSLKLVFNPVGKHVITHYGKHPVKNTFALIFGGLEMFLALQLSSFVFYLSIIGIPFGIQINKISYFFLAPFGAEIVEFGQFTENRSSSYDLNVLIQSISENPGVKFKYSDGTEATLMQAIKRNPNAKELTLRCHKKAKRTIIFSVVFLAVGIGLFYSLHMAFGIFGSQLGPNAYIVGGPASLALFFIFVILVSLFANIRFKIQANYIRELLGQGIYYYPAPKRSPYTGGSLNKDIRIKKNQIFSYNKILKMLEENND